MLASPLALFFGYDVLPFAYVCCALDAHCLSLFLSLCCFYVGDCAKPRHAPLEASLLGPLYVYPHILGPFALGSRPGR